MLEQSLALFRQVIFAIQAWIKIYFLFGHCL